MTKPAIRPPRKPTTPGAITAVRLIDGGPVIFGRVVATTKNGRIIRWSPLDSDKTYRYKQAYAYWVTDRPLNALRMHAAYLNEQPRFEDQYAAANWVRRFVLETPK